MALSLRKRVGFALGDTGFNFVWQSIELYLLFFYLNVLHLPAGWAAAIFFAGAIVDWVSDPVIGALADRTAARTGRMRVWMIGAAPVIGVALPLAFAKPWADPVRLFWWALASHLLLRISYSAGNIPYAALTARITTDPAEQARLTGLRMQCAALGGLTVAGVYWSAPQLSGGDPGRFFAGAALLGLMIQPLLYLTWTSATEVARPRGLVRAYSFKREMLGLFRLARQHRELQRLLSIVLLAGLTTSVVGSSILFLFALDLKRAELGYPATFLPALALLLATPGWIALHERTGTSATLANAALVHLCGLLGLTGAIMFDAPLALSCLCLAVAIVATTGLSVMFWAMVPAIATEVGATAGDCEARVYALATTARKLSQAIATPLLILGLWASDVAFGEKQVAPALALVAVLSAIGILRFAPRPATSDRKTSG